MPSINKKAGLALCLVHVLLVAATARDMSKMLSRAKRFAHVNQDLSSRVLRRFNGKGKGSDCIPLSSAVSSGSMKSQIRNLRKNFSAKNGSENGKGKGSSSSSEAPVSEAIHPVCFVCQSASFSDKMVFLVCCLIR